MKLGRDDAGALFVFFVVSPCVQADVPAAILLGGLNVDAPADVPAAIFLDLAGAVDGAFDLDAAVWAAFDLAVAVGAAFDLAAEVGGAVGVACCVDDSPGCYKHKNEDILNSR